MVKSRKTLNKNKSSGFVLDQTTLGVGLVGSFALISLIMGAYAVTSGVFDQPVSAEISISQSTMVSTNQASYIDDSNSKSEESSSIETDTSTVDREPISESNPVKEAPDTEANATAVSAPITHDYLIVWGDTLSELAVSNDVPMSTLVDLNHIKNPDLIYAGDIMKFPN